MRNKLTICGLLFKQIKNLLQIKKSTIQNNKMVKLLTQIKQFILY